MADYGLTSSGFRKMTEAELFEDFESALRAEYGHDEGTGVDAYWGHFGHIESERLASIWDVLESIYQQISPGDAEGVPLQKVCYISNIKKLPATQSLCPDVTFNGLNGTIIPIGTLVSVGATDQFETIAAATIGVSGYVLIDCQSVEYGAIKANAGTLNTIVEAVAGLTSVVNQYDAELGREIETDTDLRTRRARSLRIIGSTTFGALAAQMIDPDDGVEDITALLLVMNDTDTDYTGSGGLPPHSFEFTIAGGDQDEILEKIFELKPAGIWSYTGASGAAAITDSVLDSFLNSHSISFSRNTLTEIWVHVRITVSSEFDQGRKQNEQVDVLAAVTGDYVATINNVDFTYHAVTSGAITKYADAGGGNVRVTSANHGLEVGDKIDITGSVNYDGTYTIGVGCIITVNEFDITAAWVVDDAAGTWEKFGGADNVNDIAEGLANAIETSTDWVPVTASHNAGESFFTLQGDYKGCPFVVTVSPTANIEVDASVKITASGDQQLVISEMLEYAEGDEDTDGIQIIGADVELWKYNNPVSRVDNITGLRVYMENSQPATAPIAGWGTDDIEIDNRHEADFSTTRITVEVVTVL